MVAQATQDAVQQSEQALAVLYAKWDGVYASVEIVKRCGGDWLPLLDECDRIAATVSAARARHRAASLRLVREVAATAEKYLGQWWDSDQYGESVLDETTQHFLNGGEELDY